jgi:hypothetical protein
MQRVVSLALVSFSIASYCVAARAADQKPPTVENTPPVVVKTVPEAGDTKVDPATAEIKVTFSKKMADGSWSWTQISKETFPTIAGKSRYESDGKTCVLPVKLEPGKTYVLWLNSQKFGNFRDAKGRSAVPYLLVFETEQK